MILKNWEEFEKWFSSTDFPKNLEGLKDIPVIDNWIHQFRQATSGPNKAKGKEQKDTYLIKEGKEMIEIIFSLPNGYEVEDLLLFVREDFVKIEGLPDQHIELIKLPKLVKARVCRAKIQEDKLIIRLSKRPRAIKFFRHSITN